jgi:nicotinamidase-related amidase
MAMQFISTDDFDKKIVEWQAIMQVAEDKILLESPALLVLDMQNDFLTDNGLLPVWAGKAVIPRINQAIKLFRKAGLPIFFTQHFCLNPYRHKDEIDSMKHLKDPSQLLKKGTNGIKIHSDILVDESDNIITKYSYSAFHDTTLDTLLRLSHVKEVVIAGVATNICCETTAHDAFFRGFNVRFLLDCTGGTDEAAHLATLKNIKLAYGKVTSLDRIRLPSASI